MWSLREIGLDVWKDWESVASEIKEYFYEQYGALGNIFPDPMKLLAIQDYTADIVVSDDACQ